MYKWLTALIAVITVTVAATAAFACNGDSVNVPPPPEVQAPPAGGGPT